MFEYDFIKLVSQYVKIYGSYPLPIIICDIGLQVYWANDPAKKGFGRLIKSEGMAELLSELEREKLIGDMQKKGSVTLSGILPFSGINIILTPIFNKSDVAGITVALINEAEIPIPSSQVGKSAEAFARNMYQSVGGIFSASDAAYLKSVMMDEASWLSPNLNRITAAAYQILRMGMNFAEYAKHQSGDATHNFTAVDIFAWLRGISDAVKVIAKNAGSPVEFDIENGSAFARVDLDAFEAGFYNIIYNSLFFTRENNLLRISAFRSDGITIKISDLGMGMDEKTLKKVFKPYFTHANLKGNSGVGLGLTLARLTMNAHGGEIVIESKPGEGTDVTLSLPPMPFSHPLPLDQGSAGEEKARLSVRDRFSALHVGLMGIYGENESQ